MTDKIQRSYNPLHPSKTRSRHTQPRTPAPPPKERIRQNPLHNVKQPKPGIEYPHDSSPAIRKIKPRLQTVDHANHTVFTATTLSGPTARSARCLRGRPALVEPLSVTVGSGGADRDRTGDLLLAKQALSQLSYGPSFALRASEGFARIARQSRPFELPRAPGWPAIRSPAGAKDGGPGKT